MSDPAARPLPPPGQAAVPPPAADPARPGTAAQPPGVVTGRPRTAGPAPATAPAVPAEVPAPEVQAVQAAAPGAPGVLTPAAAYTRGRGQDGVRADAAWAATALAAGVGTGTSRPAVLDDRADLAAAGAAGPADAVAAPDHHRGPPVRRPGRPVVPRRPWTLLGVHVLQLVVVEVALVAVVLVHREPWPVLVPVVAAAVLAAVLTLGRHDGRWLWQRVGRRLRHVTTPRGAAVPTAGADPRATADDLLAALAGGGWVDTVVVDGEPAALLDHPGGVAVAVEAMPATENRFARGTVRLPSLAALLPAGEDADTRLTAQLLVQTVPAPGRARAGTPVGLSWQELTGGRAVARRRCWIVLQVQRTPAVTDPGELRATVVNAVRRVQRQVRRAGLRGHLLTPDEARAGLLALAGAEAGPDGRVRLPGGGSGSRAGWRGWTSGDRRHVALRVTDWPDLGADPGGARLVTALGAAAPVPSVVAVAARRTPDGDLDVEGTLRLVLGADEPEGTVVDDVREAARAAGARLRRADGEHRAGVAGTLALGGFVR
ncbi:type VII secretion protein EccE [Klenkia brasiliensis]|uniref:Type VII secretion protein EccE n=1 Tax=Klenkia brasiliensis TaxID=333142 RepID=A0A1G7QJC1_9ACTN|nr:type VII secretion protein EccE [Klenkia brasiliensis]SDF97720.1 type VII secretion protein EccE [Klenkia brasiliensis]